MEVQRRERRGRFILETAIYWRIRANSNDEMEWEWPLWIRMALEEWLYSFEWHHRTIEVRWFPYGIGEGHTWANIEPAYYSIVNYSIVEACLSQISQEMFQWTKARTLPGKLAKVSGCRNQTGVRELQLVKSDRARDEQSGEVTTNWGQAIDIERLTFFEDHRTRINIEPIILIIGGDIFKTFLSAIIQHNINTSIVHIAILIAYATHYFLWATPCCGPPAFCTVHLFSAVHSQV